MKHFNLVLLAAVVGVASGCATRTKLLDISAVSMTHVPGGQQMEDKGPVTGEFCGNSFNDKGEIGLIDEAIKNAQSTHKVDFIKNVTVWQSSNSCVSIEGQGYTVAGAAGAASTKKK